jgi:nitrite reductase/ring-hydroxylating ferredoxin subunit
MSEDGSRLVALRPAGSPAGVDLRRVGAHPDYWYPIAWADELKVGKALGRRFAGEPIVIYRGKSGQVFALEDRCAHRQVPLHLGVVTGDRRFDLRLSGRCHACREPTADDPRLFAAQGLQDAALES